MRLGFPLEEPASWEVGVTHENYPPVPSIIKYFKVLSKEGIQMAVVDAKGGMRYAFPPYASGFWCLFM